MNLVAAVLTPAAVLTAIVGGLLFGFVLISELIQSDRFGNATANAKVFGVLIGVLAIALGFVFYVGQIASAIADDDPQWPRAAARYVLWVVFSVATGLGTWAGLHREWRHR